MKKLLKNTRSDQRGLTLISWMIVLVFLLSQVVIAMNVVPVYLTDSTVKSVLEDLPNDPKVGQMTKKELRDTVFKRLNISSVYSVTPSHIKVTKGRNVNIVTVEYEPRGTLIGNLEYIVHFKHEVKITTR